MSNMEQLKVKDTVKTAQGLVGIVESMGTELGPDYVSVRFSPNGFCMQLHRDTLVVVEDYFSIEDNI